MKLLRQNSRRFVASWQHLFFALLASTMLLPAASAQLIELRGQLRDQVESLRGSQSTSAWESWKNATGWYAIEAQLRPGAKVDPAAIEKVRQKILTRATINEQEMAVVKTLQALAETTQPLADTDRAEYLTTVASQLVPATEAELSAARARLKKQLGLLEPKLRAYKDQGQAWKKYLHWKETEQLLSEQAPARELLRKIEARWAVAPLAWDIALIRDCGTEVQAVAVLLRRDAETVKQATAALAAAKDALSNPLQPKELNAVLPLLNSLAEMDLGSRLTEELRRSQSRSMTTIAMLPSFLGGNTAVNQNFPVNGVYGGSNATGNGQIQGNRSTTLIADPTAVRFQATFSGTNSSQTTSSTQGVRVNSSATSQVNASKDFTFRPTGIISSPATASAATSLQYTGIGVGGNRRYQAEARSRAQATRGRSEQDAKFAVERGTRESMDNEGSRMITDFQKSYQRDVLQPLYYQSLFQPRITTNSTRQAAYWQMTLLRPHELLLLPPAPELVPTMLQTTAHQTFPERTLEVRFGGNTLDQSNWRKIIGKQFAERITKAGNDDDSDWSIRLPGEVPCKFDFSENNIVRVKIRLENFKNDEYEHDHVDLQLQFESQVVNGKWVLKRSQQPEVLFLADPATGKYEEQISGRQLSLRSMLRRRLEKLLGEEVVLTPRDLGFPPHNGRALAFEAILCRDQWLVMNMK